MDCLRSGPRHAFWISAGTVLLAVVTSQPALPWAQHTAHKQDFKHQVQSLEAQWRTAQLSGDLTTMDRLLSEDYVGISITGQVNTKAQQLDRIRKHLFQLTRMDLIDTKVKVLGDVAIVTSLASVDGVNEGSPVSGNFRYTRIYQHLANGAWKITNFEATRIPTHAEHKAALASRLQNPS